MVDNWVDNNEATQIDDDEVFVDNTQQEINEEPTQKRKRVGKTRSDCWKSFEKIVIDGVRHGNCKWCERVLKADGNNTDAVRYIRKSTQRIVLFKKCMKAVGVESTKFLCKDCPTHWNSTYDLLKIAVDLEKAFYEYEMEDRSFARDVVTPVSEDFVTCREMVSFLEKFKVKIELVSTT